MRIAVIGAGSVGRALGGRFGAAGHDVVFGVRNPTRADGVSPAMTVPEAVRDAEAVLVAVPWEAVPEAIAAAGDLGGKIILDATNPLTFGAEGLALALGFSTSGGEQIAALAKGAKVFKVFNTIGAEVMAAPSSAGGRPVMFVAGDDQDAKARVLALVDQTGFEPVDAGPLRNARLLEAHAMLWIDLALNRGLGRDFAFGFVRRTGERG